MESTRLISNPIHKKKSDNTHRYSSSDNLEEDESNNAKKLNRLRISVVN